MKKIMMLTRHACKRWNQVFHQPVRIAQTRRGLLLAACLVLLSQLHRDVMAGHLSNPGSTQSTYYRVEWEYDLAMGAGRISLIVNDDQPDEFLAFFDPLSFRTKGVELTNIEATRPNDPSGPLAITGGVSGVMDGLDLYSYEIPPAGAPLAYRIDDRVDVTFDFPTDQVGLWDSELSAVVILSAAVPPIEGAFSQDIQFLSVQRTVPEPASLGLLGVLATLFGLGRWRSSNQRL